MNTIVLSILVFSGFVFKNVFGNLTKLPLATLPTGLVEGIEKVSLNGRTFNAFEGIPYARPPIGKHRFKEATPVKPWEGIWKANTIHKCIQYSQYANPGDDPVIGDEDCLYVNIYTPTLSSNAKLNVFIYIHGGAFMFNYGAKQGPDYLLDNNVVYVNFNYRLGPIGFLSTEDDELPGNVGLKDQILALKWIKHNIHYFGGNPESITLIGMSAGGASVHLHYLMPKSQGLFHRGVSQSGTALNPWVIHENPLEKTKKLANSIGCPTESSHQIVKCLRRKPARQIVNAVQHFLAYMYNPFSPFAISIDGKWSMDPVLPDHPLVLLKSKQIQDLPWIVSATTEEGLYPGAFFYNGNHLHTIYNRWNEVMPFILDYNYTVVDQQEINSVSEAIKQHYLKGQPLDKSNFHEFTKVLSDRLFLNDIEKAAKLQAENTVSDVFLYSFQYRGAHSFTEAVTGSSKHIGVAHTDDTSYIFKTKMDVNSNSNDKLMSKLFIDMLLSFGSTDKLKFSTTDWLPISKVLNEPLVHLKIKSPDEIQMYNESIAKNLEFWETLPIQEHDRLLTIIINGTLPKDEL